MTRKPDVSTSLAEKELDKAEKQFESFDNQVKEMTLDRMNQAPKQELEPQTKLSQQDLSKSKDIYIKAKKTISSKEPFNEKFREDYNFSKEYVYFTAENNEIIGESIELWTKAFAGIPAEFWEIPVNKPIWAPRYVAERLKNCTYHRLIMDNTASIGADQLGQYQGRMVVDKTVNRLDAIPVSKKRSIFMGSNDIYQGASGF